MMAAQSNTHTKGSEETKDYSHDWSPEMTRYVDEISTSVWEAEEGITIVGAGTFDTMATTVWLTGGDRGEEYKVKNTIVTTGGRTEVATKTIIVVEK